jgi:DNA-binding CsgD family transcriptional regulator
MAVVRQCSASDTLDLDTKRKGIDELLREIVAQVNEGEHPALLTQPDTEQEEILVDTHVDGARYLLVRLPEPRPLLISLSPREQEIGRMVAKGYPNKTIAGVLNISTWTVCTHLRRSFAKLGVTSRAAMVARLMEERRPKDHIDGFSNRSPAALSSMRTKLKGSFTAVATMSGYLLI